MLLRTSTYPQQLLLLVGWLRWGGGGGGAGKRWGLWDFFFLARKIAVLETSPKTMLVS